MPKKFKFKFKQKLLDEYYRFLLNSKSPRIYDVVSHFALRHFDFSFIAFGSFENKEFENYRPPKSVGFNDLILDVGSRDLDSIFWFFINGYRNFRAIEPNPIYYRTLERNAKILRKLGARIEIKKGFFDILDLKGVCFIKADCESCEYDFPFRDLGIPYAMELHERQKPNEKGIYSTFVRATGYERGYCE